MLETFAQNAAQPGFVPAPAPYFDNNKPLAAGIIAEYNPFHKGHAWMIHQLRESGVEQVVCVVSGPFVQRAEAAILPVHVRARAALEAGADLVLRLPVRWATASAEGFAQGAVGLLSALGCVDILAFGSELGEVEPLEQTAQALLDPAFPLLLRAQLEKGVSFATARAAAAEQLLPGAGDILRTPNNLLGVEYCKALQDVVPQALRARMDPQMQLRVVQGLYGNLPDRDHLFPLPVPMALPRVGASHDGAPLGGFASASWLRAQGVSAWPGWVPDACMPLYQKAQDQGQVLDYSRYETMMLARLRGLSADQFLQAAGCGEGLENRLAAAAKQATSLEELYALAKSKRFAHSRIRRLALRTALQLPEGAPPIPPYAHVLAAGGKGLALLRTIKEKSMIPLSTSLARLKALPQAQEEISFEAFCEDIYSLCLQKPLPGGNCFTQPAAILAKNRE